MLNRRVIIAALVVYGCVLGCVMWPTSAPARNGANDPSTDVSAPHTPLEGLPYRGVAMEIQRVDWIEKYEKSIDEIADLGADTVSFVVDARQENGSSSVIFLDMRMTPTPEKLGELIGHAKKRGLRVILMPIVLLQDPKTFSDHSEWRGNIAPLDWAKWFDSYRDILTHFAGIAEVNHVDVLSVGSELVSAEPKIEEWTRTIKAVRKIFHGHLTYSSNWDHYTVVPFWNQLDLIGMNSYWKMGPDRDPSVPVSEIKNRWKAIQADLLPWVKKTGKPLLFLEIGWFSQANTAYEPWDYTKEEEPIDLDLQKRLYEAFFESWYGNPHLGGFIVWEWPPVEGGPENKGYTPKNKPAEKVLRDYLGKPRWDVK